MRKHSGLGFRYVAHSLHCMFFSKFDDAENDNLEFLRINTDKSFFLKRRSALDIILFIFLFSLTSLSRLFHSYRDEPIGRWGETGVPRENHLTHPQAELGLSHMWPVRGSNLHQRALKFSDLTHSATGAAP